MEPKKFSVVFFPTDNSVEVVPSLWLSENQEKCPFPVGRSKGLRKLQEDASSTPDAHWPIWDVDLLKAFDTFAKANKKAQSLLKKRNLEVSESEDQACSKSKGRGGTDGLAQFFDAPNENLFLGNNSEPALDGQQFLNRMPAAEFQQLADNENQEAGNTAGGTLEIIQVEDPRVATLIDEFRAFQHTSIQKQLSILEELKEIKRLALRNLGNTNPVDTTNPIWALKSEEDLRSCEVLLTVTQNFVKEVALLSKIGGNTVPKAVNNVMKFVIAHYLALKLRQTSHTGKIPFGGTVTAKLVRESVRKFYEVEQAGDPILKLQLTDDNLDSLIGKWLRDSPGRGQDGKTRRQPNRNATINESAPDPENIEDNAGENPPIIHDQD